MGYVIFELCIFVSWAAVFLTRFRRDDRRATEDLLVLFFAIPTTIIVEISNEFLYPNEGAYYPSSLLYFPAFHFTVGIVLAGSLYAWGLYAWSRKIITRFASNKGRFLGLIQLGIIPILLPTFVILELLGVSTGYWEYYLISPRSFLGWVDVFANTFLFSGMYVFYFLFIFPPALIGTFFSSRLKRIARPEPPL